MGTRKPTWPPGLGPRLGLSGLLMATTLLAIDCGGDGVPAPPPPVASVLLVTSTATLLVGGTEQLTATTKDGDGDVLSGRAVAWSSSDPSVATVSVTGLVAAVSPGTVTITATSEGVSGTGDVAVIRLTFAEVSAGDHRTCGVTAAGIAACWGPGDGSGSDQLGPVLVADGLRLTSVTTAGGEDFDPGDHVCGVTTSGAGYCWGLNANAELGDGSMTDRSTPTLVVGGLSFVSVSAGTYHTCGLTAGGAAYCWGFNGHGELGDGTTTNRSTPTLVALSFLAISSGNTHTCGLTGAGAAYCWGDNDTGRLGDGTTTDRLAPTPVVQ